MLTLSLRATERMDLESMSVTELKAMILERGGSVTDCFEKSDLVSRARLLAGQHFGSLLEEEEKAQKGRAAPGRNLGQGQCV